ncbi:GroES-like protein [Metarhizium guizhouense ARSEF 977]|uniref:GroES-like protein n=1 Tax=Metarhizium guizhouense (strain ARSEF 977) TaxID=1276136 RepID=A0A0B4HSW4_METGA|nr:GroES-like protein [Metarhizium guizhouense ARSEF 977]
MGNSQVPDETPPSQTVLLLRAPRQRYDLVEEYPVPRLAHESEVLVRNRAIGLNPIDWKAPDFGFGLPPLPCIAGRELAGEVAQVSPGNTRWKVGDRVAVISTDYRDPRKAAYQQFVVAREHTVVRLPARMSYEQGSAFGVAFAAAALALGVSLGADFSPVLDGPDLYRAVRGLGEDKLPRDVAVECLDGLEPDERPAAGDWLAVWGGSATSAHLAIQLARLVGLRVAVVVDSAKHGRWLSGHAVIRPDLLVDSYDPARAVDVLRTATGGRLRFGLDTRGRESATYLLQALQQTACDAGGGATPLMSPPGTPRRAKRRRGHLVGLAGLPKGSEGDDVVLHTVPIKLFHEVESIGGALVAWAAALLDKSLLLPPDIVDVEYGLDSVNAGLDRMRNGEISGGKLVVKV